MRIVQQFIAGKGRGALLRVPEGRLKVNTIWHLAFFIRPSGNLGRSSTSLPTDKSLGYYRPSLREKEPSENVQTPVPQLCSGYFFKTKFRTLSALVGFGPLQVSRVG